MGNHDLLAMDCSLNGRASPLAGERRGDGEVPDPTAFPLPAALVREKRRKPRGPALKPACLWRQEGLGQSASPRASLRAASRGLRTQQNRLGPFLASCPARPSIVAVASLGARARGRLPAASEALALSQRS